MCGLAGQVGISMDRTLVEPMINSIEHRGPDGKGFAYGENFAFGMCRLAIIDVENGSQPVFNEDKNVTCIFNGQIYNYKSLQQSLIIKGHKLISNSDAEIIPHMYEEYGENFIDLIEGMFAIAIYDSKSNKLILYRDRLGEKPLLYSIDHNKGLYFASEIKAFKNLPIDMEVDLTALNNVLQFGYIQGNRTIYQSISKLKPGHKLRWQSGRISIEKYWKATLVKNNSNNFDNRSKLKEVFEETVAKTTQSERNLGAFLSGGIDSSLVVATMAMQASTPVKTFSIGFKEKLYDETLYSRIVSKIYKTEHTEMIIENQIEDLVLEMSKSYDEPFADSSALPTFALCKLAANKVTVALSGDGGDEAFGGYDRYRFLKLTQNLSNFNKIGLSKFGDLIEAKNPNFENRYTRAIKLIASHQSSVQNYLSLMTWVKKEHRDKIWKKELLSTIEQKSESEEIFLNHQHLNDSLNANRVDIETYLPGDLLYKVDIASMAHSLEVRAPFLNHHLFQFGISLQDKDRIGFFSGKKLLKEFASEILPSEIIKRKKQGFGIPREKWLRNELKPLMHELLNSESYKSSLWFNQHYVRLLVKDFEEGEKIDGTIWVLMMIELWARENLQT